jgi:hypothetical protein
MAACLLLPEVALLSNAAKLNENEADKWRNEIVGVW